MPGPLYSFSTSRLLWVDVLLSLPALHADSCKLSKRHAFLQVIINEFGSVVGGILTQMVFANRLSGTTDISFDLWPTVLCTQTVLTFNLVTASIPYLRPFLESLESGMLRSDDLRRRGLDDSYGSSMSGSRKRSIFTLKGSDPVGNVVPAIALRPLNGTKHTATVETEPWRGDDVQSTSSQTRIINHTTTWEVNSEPMRASSSSMKYIT